MNEGDDEQSAEMLLENAARELADIHRAKDYGFWRSDTAPRLGRELGKLPPFAPFLDTWVHTGDGGYVLSTTPFGEWAIDRLVEHKSVSEIFALLEAETSRNVGLYSDVSPLLGVQIDERCDLGEGGVIEPEPEDFFERFFHRPQVASMQVPARAAMLVQDYSVTPAFEHRLAEDRFCPGSSITSPPASLRQTARRQVRLACLLAGAGAVELPITILRPKRDALFVAGAGNESGRPFDAVPFTSHPVQAAILKQAYQDIAAFSELESLSRAIDRLGRSRLAISPVDRALELGIAAEIALMHGQGEGNAEITHKIGTRAAWLLGTDPGERESIFTDMKKLYAARSQAVHSGVLTSSRATLDLDAADALVTRVLLAILRLGHFPDWTKLAMGGPPQMSS